MNDAPRQKGTAWRYPKLMKAGAAFALLLLPEMSVAEECLLSAQLIVKETQSGVVGETGTVWTIAPDCSFTIARQVGHKVFEPHKSGRLTSEQQARLKAMLEGVSAPQVASAAEGAPAVNPHRITLSYGARHTVLTLPPGSTEKNRTQAFGDDHTKSILDLTAALKDMLGR